MKTYTLQQAQQLVADGKAFIENDVDDLKLLRDVTREDRYSGTTKFYDVIGCGENEAEFVGFKIKLSQIQPEPIPNDVIKIVEKYGDKLLTYYELLKK